MKDHRIIKLFSVFSLIVTFSFMAVFTYLAILYDYPDNLDFTAKAMLPGIYQADNDWLAIWFL